MAFQTLENTQHSRYARFAYLIYRGPPSPPRTVARGMTSLRLGRGLPNAPCLERLAERDATNSSRSAIASIMAIRFSASSRVQPAFHDPLVVNPDPHARFPPGLFGQFQIRELHPDPASAGASITKHEVGNFVRQIDGPIDVVDHIVNPTSPIRPIVTI